MKVTNASEKLSRFAVLAKKQPRLTLKLQSSHSMLSKKSLVVASRRPKRLDKQSIKQS